jgi:thioredoxin reductase (NADPH)
LTEVPLDGVFIAIGHTPNTALFRGQIELDEAGYIRDASRLEDELPWRVCGRRRPGTTSTVRRFTAAGSGCMAAIDTERYLDGLPIPDETTDNAECLVAPPNNEVFKP